MTEKIKFMLQQFTWSHFLIAAAIFTVLWYLILLLTVFRQDVLAYVSPGVGGKEKGSETVDSGTAKESPISAPDLMGKSKLPDGLETVRMSKLNFVQGFNSADDGNLGIVPDVLQELKEVFSTLESEDGNKKDFFALVGMISEKYGSIGTHPNITQINDFIRERAPFAITDEELENIWI